MKSAWALLVLPVALVSAHSNFRDLAAAGDGVIKLSAETFDLLTAPKRNWSAAIQFTALSPRYKCNPCRNFDPKWRAVARAWARVPSEHRNSHFFATIDVENAPSVFQKLGIQSAPLVHVYPPTEGPRNTGGKGLPSSYDFRNGFDAAPLAEHLSKHTPVSIPYKDPIDWARWAIIAVAGLSCALALPYLSPILQNRWIWAFGTIITSLVMTGGYMFTRIRQTPYAEGNGNWIAAGYQNQFGQEVQVVALIYGLLSLSFIMLTLMVPTQQSSMKQRLQVYLWTAVIVILNSLLISLFRMKNNSYPFKWLF